MKEIKKFWILGVSGLILSAIVLFWASCGKNQVGSDEMESDDVPYQVDQPAWVNMGNECSDEVDNDGDGTADYYGVPAGCAADGDDFDCVLPPDTHCGVVVGGHQAYGESACRDWLDNDGDGYKDDRDIGCNVCGWYHPELDTESYYDIWPECCDGIDNDVDDKVDTADEASCYSPYDMIEEGKCGNGIDDDNDGLVDLADPGCTDIYDNDEKDPE